MTITPQADGPFATAGNVRVVAPDGTVLRETTKAYLYRCGHSAKKSLGDSSHRRIGWTESQT